MTNKSFKELKQNTQKDKHRTAWKLITSELTRKDFTKRQWEIFKNEFKLVKGN
ncbi:MAG: hypothetical protein IJO32_00410 [Bacilli bacterium]|nr:hypothetical protein [Bacilli bacterium]